MHRAIAAYQDTMEGLADLVAGMALDYASLQRPLKRCDLARCGGNCCYDGAYLGEEEADVIRELVRTSRADFKRFGLDLPGQTVVFGSWQDSISGPKTATRPSSLRQRIADYPPHFADTTCVFLLDDARCGLQLLAQERSLPPWFYKPVTCWMHPLTIESSSGNRALLTLHDEESDPQRFEGYEGFVSRTHCGRTCAGGLPAYRLLREELDFLGGLAGRDLVREIETVVADAGAG